MNLGNCIYLKHIFLIMFIHLYLIHFYKNIPLIINFLSLMLNKINFYLEILCEKYSLLLPPLNISLSLYDHRLQHKK
jgi:hypothetical protein